MFKQTDSARFLTIIAVSLLFSQGAAAPEQNARADELFVPPYLKPVDLAGSNSPPLRRLSGNLTDEIHPKNYVRVSKS